MPAATIASRTRKTLRAGAAQPHFAASPRRQRRPLEDRHFLFVEESRARRRILPELLEKAGAEVTLEWHALTGVVVALSMPERFDALILDVKAPLLEIVEAGIALRAAGFDRPIIALVTGMPGKAKHSLDHAGCNFIPKSSAIPAVFVRMVADFVHSSSAAAN